MKKRIISIVVCLSMLISTMPAIASDVQLNLVENNYEDQAIISKQNSDVHTITFEESTLSGNTSRALANSSISYEEAQAQLVKNHNIAAVEKAKDYVESLHLAEAGLEYIEEFCLNELDYYMNIEDAQLLSYTVYTPKSPLSSSLSETDMLYFGTYGGLDFYFYYPSEAELKTNVKKQTSTSVLQYWVNNILNCIMSFSGTEVSVAWSVFRTLMGAPQQYKVTTGAFTENYANLNIKTRCIYEENYSKVLSSQQFANVYPYMVFHPVDSPTYLGSYNYDCGYQGMVYSRKYKDNVTDLCKEAWQIYYGTLVVDRFDTIDTSTFKTIWE